MNNRYLRGRVPKKTSGFSWCRIVDGSGLVTYRLYRRDQRGALHYFIRAFSREEIGTRGLREVANELRRARHALRDQVDEVDLALMGVV